MFFLRFYAKPVGSEIYRNRSKNIKIKEISHCISLIINSIKNIFRKRKIYLFFDNMCFKFDKK